MIENIDILNREGIVIKSVIITDDCERKKSLQSENYVSVKYKDTECAVFPEGSYILYKGEKFALTSVYTPAWQNGVYIYDMRFSGIEERLSGPVFFRYEKTEDVEYREPEFDVNITFGGCFDMVIDSLCDRFPDIVWSKSGDIPGTEYKALSFSGMKFKEALDYIAKEFETEWWFESRYEESSMKEYCILHLEKCEYGDYIELGRGRSQLSADEEKEYLGLESFTCENTAEEIPARIFVYGSERNIRPTAEDFGTPYRKRLQLPAGLRYVEVPGKTGNTEAIKFFEEVYPRRVGEITSLRVEEGQNGDKYYFKDAELGSDFKIQMAGDDKLRVKFESGVLNGREFDTSFDEKTREFFIEPFLENNVSIPGGVLIPKAKTERAPGDRYVLSGMVMPKSYVTSAQNELLQKAEEYAETLSKTVPSVNCVADPVYFTKEGIEIRLGRKIRIADPDFPKDTVTGICYLQSRVMEFSYRLTAEPCITFRIAESVSTGRFARIEDKIAEQGSQIDGVYQSARTFSMRGWHDSLELSGMIDSLRSDLLLIGNPDGQFSTTCVFQSIYENDKNKFYISSGVLKHTVYTDVPSKGVWRIETYVGTLPTGRDNVPFYIYACCDKASDGCTIYYSETVREHTETHFYFLLGTLSSVVGNKRSFNLVSGFTQIAGDSITTGRIQDAGNNLIIDLSANPPCITAKNGACIKGHIEFGSSSSGLSSLREWTAMADEVSDSRAIADEAKSSVDNLQIGGRNYLLNSDVTVSTDNPDTEAVAYFAFSEDPVENLKILNSFRGKYVTVSMDADITAVDTSKGHWSFTCWCFLDDAGTRPLSISTDTNNKSYTGRISYTQFIPDEEIKSMSYMIMLIQKGYTGSLSKPKIEIGMKPTDWTPAPEDIQAGLQQAVDMAEAAELSAQTSLMRIDTITNDNIFSAQEKRALLPEWNALVNEKTQLLENASLYGISLSAYNDAYTDLYNYVNPLMRKSETDSPGDGGIFNGIYFRQLFTLFYNTRNDLCRQIEKQAKVQVDNMQIGGRNFFLKSEERACDNGSTQWYFQSSEEYRAFPFRFTELAGKWVTISFDCEASNIPDYDYAEQFNVGVQIFAVAKNEGTPNLNLISHLHSGLLSDGRSFKGCISKSFRVDDIELKPLGEANEFVAVQNTYYNKTGFDGVNNASVKIWNIKIEFGNKPTGWTPAPEDTLRRISDFDYLRQVFNKGTTDIDGGVVLSNFLGVRSKNNTTVTGGMMGEVRDDATPLLFSGASGEGTLSERAKNAVFNVCSNGSGRWGIFNIDEKSIQIRDNDSNLKVLFINEPIETVDKGLGTENSKNENLGIVRSAEKTVVVSDPTFYESVDERIDIASVILPAGYYTVYINMDVVMDLVLSSTDAQSGSGFIDARCTFCLDFPDGTETLAELAGEAGTVTGNRSVSRNISYTRAVQVAEGQSVRLRLYALHFRETYLQLSHSLDLLSSKTTVTVNKKSAKPVISGVREENRMVIGSDGILVKYDSNNYFEVKKNKDNRIAIRATLPRNPTLDELEQNIAINELYVSGGFLKIKENDEQEQVF